ncbi:MAG: hypothetical protein HUJ53_09775 [Holdemanella sp.]|nr:hypothetical protein [Holdemanella sp.]
MSKEDKEIKALSRRAMLVMIGHCGVSDIMDFVPCCYQKAKKILEEIRTQNTMNGIENLDHDRILTSRLVKYMGLTENKIFEYESRRIELSKDD